MLINDRSIRKYVVAFALFAVFSKAIACPNDASVQSPRSPDSLMDEADVAFFGTLIQLYEEDSLSQTAIFQINEAYKGRWANSIIIRNKQVLRCWRRFQGIGQRFYVFASADEDTGDYVIDNRGGFVTEGEAKELSFDLRPDS